MWVQATKGFTLVEILVVVVIVAVMTALGVQMLSAGSVERNLQQHGRQIQASLNFSCDQAILQNRSHGISFFNEGYQFSQYVDQQWLSLADEMDYAYHEFQDGSVLSLRIEDQSIVLGDEPTELPQVVCDASGELTPFSVLISDASKAHHYRLKTINFWQLQGGWDESL